MTHKSLWELVRYDAARDMDVSESLFFVCGVQVLEEKNTQHNVVEHKSLTTKKYHWKNSTEIASNERKYVTMYINSDTIKLFKNSRLSSKKE